MYTMMRYIKRYAPNSVITDAARDLLNASELTHRELDDQELIFGDTPKERANESV